MKIGKLLLAKILVVAALSGATENSRAACGDPGEDLLTALGNASAVLLNEAAERTNNPSATSKERREAVAIARALNTLSIPGTNSTQLYNLFLKAALQLGPLALQDPEIGGAGSAVFDMFMAQAIADIDCTSNRVASLGQFARTKRAASNQVVQAQRTLVAISQQTNPQIGLLLARQLFHKIFLGNKLAAKAEANPGFAPDGVIARTLTYAEGGETGTITFDTDTQATEVESEEISTLSYVYTRTALNNALLVLTDPGETGGTNVVTVKLKYQSNTNGTFSYTFRDDDGSRGSGSGRFTIE